MFKPTPVNPEPSNLTGSHPPRREAASETVAEAVTSPLGPWPAPEVLSSC